MKTYEYLNDKVANVDRRARRYENVLTPLTMSRMRIGDRVAVLSPNYEILGIGSVIKASPTELEVPMCGEFMVFNLEDTAEWTNAGYEVLVV